MIKKIIILLAVVSVACALDKAVYKEWKSHIAKYNRKFSTSHESRKSFQNFAESYNMVMDQNRKFAAGLSTYRASLNHLSDIGRDEIANITGLIDDQSLFPTFNKKRSVLGYARDGLGYTVKVIGYKSGDSIPSKVDHSAKAGIVRDQKQCGSCYAHATMKAIEMNINLKYGVKYNLAPQQLVDCSHTEKSVFRNQGCNGGIIYYSFDFTKNITDSQRCLALESDMPYKEEYISSTQCSREQQCAKHNKVPFSVVDYEINNRNDLNAIKEILSRGPAFAQLYVDREFMQYESGIFCGTDGKKGYTVNHAVVAVGYGVENGKEYIKILNSWNDQWGENGFIKVDPACINVSQLVARPIIERV